MLLQEVFPSVAVTICRRGKLALAIRLLERPRRKVGYSGCFYAVILTYYFRSWARSHTNPNCMRKESSERLVEKPQFSVRRQFLRVS